MKVKSTAANGHATDPLELKSEWIVNSSNSKGGATKKLSTSGEAGAQASVRKA